MSNDWEPESPLACEEEQRWMADQAEQDEAEATPPPVLGEEDNPRLQCERCGKWRRLITKGEQIMFPYYVEGADGEWVDCLYDNLCEPCRTVLDQCKKEFTKIALGREIDRQQTRSQVLSEVAEKVIGMNVLHEPDCPRWQDEPNCGPQCVSKAMNRMLHKQRIALDKLEEGK
jgi:hypothetical protein